MLVVKMHDTFWQKTSCEIVDGLQWHVTESV